MDILEEVKQILREVAISQRETAERFKETDAKFKETDATVKELVASQKATEKRFKELGKQIGGIGEKFGSFTEGLAYPSLRKMLKNKYSIDNTMPNFQKRFADGSEIELDVFGYTNGNINNAVIVEVKSHLQSKHIYSFAELLANFKTNFPEFGDKHLYGILATVRNVSKELREEIKENGLSLAIIHDDIFDLEANPNARDWNH